MFDSPYLFNGQLFGQPQFDELTDFYNAVRRRLPRLVRHLESGGRGELFDGPQHGLMILGAAGWIGTLFANSLGEYHLCHACIDACCFFGLQAAHLIAIELLRNTMAEILRSNDIVVIINAMRAAEAQVARCPNKAQATVLAALPSRAQCKQMQFNFHHSLKQQKALWDRQAARGLNLAFLSESHRQWTVELHPLCPASQRAAVRTLVLMQEREFTPISWLPKEILISRILSYVPIEAEPKNNAEPSCETDGPQGR